MQNLLFDPKSVCPEGKKFYGTQCLEENTWNEFNFFISDPGVWISTIFFTINILIWFMFIRYGLKKEVSLLKKVLALVITLILTFVVFFLTVLFGQIINIQLLGSF